MTIILLKNSVTATVVIGFVQNRLTEFNIDDVIIRPYLLDFSHTLTTLIKAHFTNNIYLPTEEDLYYDEMSFEFKKVIESIKSLDIERDQIKKLIFVIIKVLDQILIEAKETQLNTLSDLTVKAEMDLFNII